MAVFQTQEMQEFIGTKKNAEKFKQEVIIGCGTINL